MLETAVTVISALATLLGLAKGSLELFNGIKSIRSTSQSESILKLIYSKSDKKESKIIEEVYKNLAGASSYVVNLVKRIKNRFILIGSLITVVWVLLVWRTMKFISTLFLDYQYLSAAVIVLASLSLFFFSDRRINNIRLIWTGRAIETGNSKKLFAPEILEDISAKVSHIFKEASAYMPSSLTLFRLNPLSNSELNFLKAYVQIRQLIETIEAYLLKSRLREVQREFEQIFYNEYREIVTEMICDLISKNTLKKKPDTKKEIEQWRAEQKNNIQKEFNNLGLEILLRTAGESFFDNDFAKQFESGDKAGIKSIVTEYFGKL